MSNPTTADDVNLCLQISQAMWDDLVYAIGLDALVTELNQNQRLVAASDHRHEAHGLNMCNHVMIYTLILAICRVHDSYDAQKGRGKDRSSLPRIHAILAKPDVQEEFIERARKWNPHLHLADNDARDVAIQIQAAQRAFKAFHDDKELSRKLAAAREFRDHHLAHRLHTERQGTIKFSDFHELLNHTIELAKPVWFVVGGTIRDIEHVSQIHAGRARSFVAMMVAGLVATNTGQEVGPEI